MLDVAILLGATVTSSRLPPPFVDPLCSRSPATLDVNPCKFGRQSIQLGTSIDANSAGLRQFWLTMAARRQNFQMNEGTDARAPNHDRHVPYANFSRSTNEARVPNFSAVLTLAFFGTPSPINDDPFVLAFPMLSHFHFGALRPERNDPCSLRRFGMRRNGDGMP